MFASVVSAADTSEGVAFFENRIRPVLVDKCYECHSPKAKKIKGGLLLDTRAGIRRGGDTGLAVVPGELAKSLLIEAIHHEDKDLSMPPKEKLPDEVIADFEKWIAMGAPDPREGVLTTPQTAPVNPAQSGGLQLAEWIASARHPLTARVMVNRIWQHLFGVGLVETPDDFGKTGQPPSDPALLDHLASRFIAHGWSVKKLIAEIMSSRVYQLGTGHDAKAFEVDPANRLHWRMNRRRLDSDALLDSIRAISGELTYRAAAPLVSGKHEGGKR